MSGDNSSNDEEVYCLEISLIVSENRLVNILVNFGNTLISMQMISLQRSSSLILYHVRGWVPFHNELKESIKMKVYRNSK